MPKEKLKKGKKKNGFNNFIAKKVLEPYMTIILQTAYDLRSLSYSMPFDRWCEKFNEHLKENINGGIKEC